ncbi:MAG: HAD-IIB family hydrolase, partial [Planctomycetales bacterium]|nr:HAD-IIB family hydrolase [Planctomycetales bacterium]
TLLGDDDALDRFAELFDGLRDRVLLAYNSGRFVASVLDSVRATALPMPDAVIGGVGTQVHLLNLGSPAAAWPTVNGDWNAQLVRRVAMARGQLEPQPEHLQSQYKVSFFGYDLSPAYLSGLEVDCTRAGLAVRIVYSSSRDLDILPATAGKGKATAFLAEQLQVAAERVIVAGDSGNDLAMFAEGFAGIVVANAHAELKSLQGDRVYHAQAGYAAGVAEGLQHWLSRAADATCAS